MECLARRKTYELYLHEHVFQNSCFMLIALDRGKFDLLDLDRAELNPTYRPWRCMSNNTIYSEIYRKQEITRKGEESLIKRLYQMDKRASIMGTVRFWYVKVDLWLLPLVISGIVGAWKQGLIYI